jgi:hypothetical protein
LTTQGSVSGTIAYAPVQSSTTSAASVSGWDGGNNAKFWQIDIATLGYSNLKLSSVQRSSNTGPKDFKVQYKIGSGSWTDVPGAAVTVANNWTTGVLNNVTLPAACNNQASVLIRWIMTSNLQVNSGNVASTGTSGIDNILINGQAEAFVEGYQNLSVGNVTSYAVTGLTSNTTYYYRVRATSANSTSANSDVISVTTEAILATFDAIAQTGFECANASFALSGLTPGANTVYYTLNGTPSSTFIFADGNGDATLDLPLTNANNGQTLAITAVELFNTPASNVAITPSANSAIAVSVTATITPTVSLSSSDADNTFAYGTGVTFTASASNLSGGTATYTFTVNGQTVQSGSSNTYTSSTIANGNQVSASISISGGSCLTATTANSTVITNTVTGAYLTSITNFCGTTLPAVNSLIRCAVPSGVVGTLGYRFKVKNNVTGVTVTLDRSVPNFDLTMTSVYTYNTSFDVQVAAIVNGVLQPYSAVCVITTPSVPLNQVGSVQCGGTLESLNTRINATTVFGSQLYRFRVALASAPDTYYYFESVFPSFRLTNVQGLPLTYGTAYLISVQSDVVINGVAYTSPYSTSCSVSTPAVTAITPASVGQCNQTLSVISDRIFINSVPNANQYTYRVALASAPTVYYSLTTSFTNFRLTSVPNLPLTFATDYLVSVQARVTIQGQDYFSNFSSPCLVSTPAYPTVGLQASQCSDGNEENPGAYQVTSSTETIYCEFVSGASYRFLLQKFVDNVAQGAVLTLDRPVNSFNLNMVHGLEAGTEYLVSVKLIYYGEGPEGKDCVIRTPNAVTTTRVAAKEFAATAYPNPFENNFLVDLTTSSQAPVSLKVYDMLGRLMTSYESKANDLSTIAIGDQYPSGVYNVVVTQDDEVRTLRVVKR